jgi:hypothetical protein
MDTDEEPSSLSLTPETETGHGRDYTICIVVGIGISFFSIGVPEGQPDAKNSLFSLLGQGVIMHSQDEFISSVV